MTRIWKGRRSSLIAVVVLALAAGVAGATLAGQATTAKKKQKGLTSKQTKQVKRLAKKKANKQIKKKAPGLSVKSSDDAKIADDATSADHATSADDAERLGGKTASELGTSSTYAEQKSDVLLTSEYQPVLDTSLKTTGKRIVATASIYMYGGNAAAQSACQLAIDTQTSYAFDQDIPLSGTSSDATLSFTSAAKVDAGTHAINLACKEKVGNVEVVYASIAAVAVGE